MMTNLRLLSLLASSALLMSCGQIKQEIWINADGSGLYETSVDMGEMLSILEAMPSEGLGAIGGEGPENILFSQLGKERVDTVFSLLATLPDSVKQILSDPQAMTKMLSDRSGGKEITEADTRQLMDNLRVLDMFMRMDKAAAELSLGLRVPFDKETGLNGAFKRMDALQTLQGQSAEAAPTTYELDGKTFRIRYSAEAAQAAMGQAMAAQGDRQMSREQLLENMSTLGMDYMSLVLHLPGEIKKIEGTTYTKLADNSILIKVPFMSIIRDGKSFNADIKFKPKKRFATTVPR